MAEENKELENEERDLNGQEALKRNSKEKSGLFAEDVNLQLDDTTTVEGTTQDISLDEKFKLKSSQKLTVFSDANNLLLAVSQTNETGTENLIASFTKSDDGKVFFNLDAEFYDQFNAKFPSVLPTIQDEEKSKATYSFEVGKVNLTKDGNINDIQLKGVAEEDNKKFGFFFSALGFQATSAAGRGLVSNQGKNPFNISVGKAFLEEQKKENSFCTMENNPALTSALHIGLINDARKKEKNPNKTISIRLPEKAEANAKDVVTLYSVPIQIEGENEIKKEFLNIKKEKGKTFVYIQSAGIKKDGTSSKVRIVPDWKEINRASLVEDKENGAYLRLDDGKSGMKSITANIKIPTRNNEDYDQLNRSLFTLINDDILKEEFKASEESLGEGKNASYAVKNGNENTNIKVKIFDYGQDQQANITSLGNDVIATMKKNATDDDNQGVVERTIVEPIPETTETQKTGGETTPPPVQDKQEVPKQEKTSQETSKKEVPEKMSGRRRGTNLKIKDKSDTVRSGLYGITLFCVAISCLAPIPFVFLSYAFAFIAAGYDLEWVNAIKKAINWITSIGHKEKKVKIKDGKEKVLQREKDYFIQQKNIKIAKYNALNQKIQDMNKANFPRLTNKQIEKNLEALKRQQKDLAVDIEYDLINIEMLDKQIEYTKAKQNFDLQQAHFNKLKEEHEATTAAQKADLKAAEEKKTKAEKKHEEAKSYKAEYLNDKAKIEEISLKTNPSPEEQEILKKLRKKWRLPESDFKSVMSSYESNLDNKVSATLESLNASTAEVDKCKSILENSSDDRAVELIEASKKADGFESEMQNILKDIKVLEKESNSPTDKRIQEIKNPDGTLTALENVVFEDLENGTSYTDRENENDFGIGKNKNENINDKKKGILEH